MQIRITYYVDFALIRRTSWAQSTGNSLAVYNYKYAVRYYSKICSFRTNEFTIYMSVIS